MNEYVEQSFYSHSEMHGDRGYANLMASKISLDIISTLDNQREKPMEDTIRMLLGPDQCTLLLTIHWLELHHVIISSHKGGWEE